MNLVLIAILGVCMLNGLQSPALAIALALIIATWPLEFLPRETSWAFFQASIFVSTGTLLVSGVPAALYERLFRPPRGSRAALYVWLAGAALLTLPAFQVMGLF
jgi:hypothetical protein